MKRIAMLAAFALAVGIGGANPSPEACGDSNTCATNGQATIPPQAPVATPALQKAFKELSNETEHALRTQQVPNDGRPR